MPIVSGMKAVAVPPQVFNDLEALSAAAAERVLDTANRAIAERGGFHIALAGGGTPRRLYELLATPGRRNPTDWSRWHIWFGDERCVPHAHVDSNFRMARTALLDQVPVPADQVHPMVVDPAQPQADAAAYARTMQAIMPTEGNVPVFDLILLGMGDDGHTASLFPGTDILEITDRPAAAVYVADKDSWRISLTYPVLDRARELLFLVAGAGKAPVIARVLGTPEASPRFPVERIAATGNVHWYLDTRAAEGLA